MLDILCFFAVNKSMGIHCELTCCSQHPRGQDLCAFSIASFVPYRPRLVAPALPPSRPALSACTALHQRAPCQPMRLQRRRVSRCTDMAATARQRRYGAQARRAGAGKRTAQDPRAKQAGGERERSACSSGACRPVHATRLGACVHGVVGQSCAPSVCCVNHGPIPSVGLFFRVPGSGIVRKETAVVSAYHRVRCAKLTHVRVLCAHAHAHARAGATVCGRSSRSVTLADADGGINNEGHNGYVKDCSSLGPDIVPGAQDVPKLMPKAVKGSKGKMSMLAGRKAAVKPPTPSSFYKTMH